MIDTTITLLTKEQYPLSVLIRFFSNNVFKNNTKRTQQNVQDAKKASVPPGTSKNYEQDFQNSDPGSQDFLFQKVSASTGFIYINVYNMSR